MSRFIVILVFLGIAQLLFGQSERKEVKGVIIYITSQNIYAKFPSTEGINKGDTIYISEEGAKSPLFIVEYLSTITCSGKLTGNKPVKPNDIVVATTKVSIKENKDEKKVGEKKVSDNNEHNAVGKESKVNDNKQSIKGRLSILSYQSYSNTSAADYQKMRYTLSFNGKNLGNSRFSLESYFSFAHRIDDWAAIKEDIFNGLKIYDLSLKYDLSKKTSLWFGRKINPKITSLGAIDGLQAETSIGNFFGGAVAGFRPDYNNYGFNRKLLEYGAYMGHNYRSKRGALYSSLGVFQQNNNGNIDRRYAYFQFDNSLINNLNIFLSGEVDLYSLVNGKPATSFSLTSLYLSLSYRVNQKLSLFASYDARKNVIYYETDKSYLDQLLEEATRQGFQFRINYHPSKIFRYGLSGGYRDRKDDLKPTLNSNGYITINNVPFINSAATVSVNYLNSSNLYGFIYGLRLSKDIVEDKLSSDLSFRYADTKLAFLTTSVGQYIGEFDLQWNINNKLSFSANYEGTFENSDRYNRFYFNLIQRF